MLIVFLLKENAILLRLESLKEKSVFHDLSYVLKHMKDIFFLFYHTNFFQPSFSDGKFVSFLLHLFMKSLIFAILSEYFPNSS